MLVVRPEPPADHLAVIRRVLDLPAAVPATEHPAWVELARAEALDRPRSIDGAPR